MNYDYALQLAKEVLDLLRPACERIEIAGGIRRGKAEPHDLEIVAKPKYFLDIDFTRSIDGSVKVDLLGERVRELIGNQFEFGDSVTQHRNGKEFKIKAPFNEKYYRVKYKGEKLDIFAVTPPAEWGPIFTIRTGDAGFTHWLVQQGWPKGIYFREGQLVRHTDLEGRYIPEGQKHAHGQCKTEPIPAPEEEDVFKVLGIPWLEPAKRIFEQGIVV